MNTHINPNMLQWAREKSKYSKEAIATRMKKSVELISMWEDGRKSPAYSTLELLAYTYYKVPLAVFYFPAPPDIEEAKKKFRRLPDYEFERLSPDTFHKISLGQAYQESLKELLAGRTRARLIFKDIVASGMKVSQLAAAVRSYLGISVEQQFSIRSNEKAFKAWRHAVEVAGVFTFKDSFEDKFISGFSLLHTEYPVIFLNNSNAFTRQTFSLMHELGHILFGVHGVSDVDESYIGYLSATEKSIEVRTNQFAAELLVPRDAFAKDVGVFQAKGIDSIKDIAHRYSVSREVILRRLLDLGEIQQDIFDDLMKQWHQDYLRIKKDKETGSYYPTKLSYLGEGFTKLAFDNYRSGRIDTVQLADHLNMDSCNISKMEKHLRW